MGRFVSSAARGGGAAQGGVYRPNRLYGALGHNGGSLASATGEAGTLWSPFMLRPGVHKVAGLWAAIGKYPGAVRLGLWDDQDGKPGALIKDCGSTAATANAYLKALFTPIEIDAGPSGRMLHVGACAATPCLIARITSGSGSEPASSDDPLYWLGYDPNTPMGNDASNSSIVYVRVGAKLSAANTPANAFTSNPDQTGVAASGIITGGLIFA